MSNELKTFSHSFKRFSIETESAALFQKSTKEECQVYLRQITNEDLCRVFILYNPWQRDMVMESISPRLQILLLEDMKTWLKSKQFRLSDCVQAEQKVSCVINVVKQNNLQVKNTKIDNKIIDHPYANALVVATCIFLELQHLIKEEEI